KNLHSLKTDLIQVCNALKLKGTILLSEEGINVNLAGLKEHICEFKNKLYTNECFTDITFRESDATFLPFKRLKIKIKNEIITFRHKKITPENQRAPEISPEQFKQWLDEKQNITVLDTRNEYEIKFGTFKQAMHLHINDFCEFIHASESLPKE